MLRDYLNLPRAVHILCIGSLINRAGSFVLIFLTIYVSEHLNLGISFATSCVGILGLGSILASLISGILSDRLGRRIVMLTALFGGAGLLVVLSRLQHPMSLMIGLFAFALVNDLYRPAAAAMIGDLTPIKSRPHAFALMYSSINLGFACAPPIGGLLVYYLSFEVLFWADAFTMAMYGLIVVLMISETLPSRMAQRPLTAAKGEGELTLAAPEAILTPEIEHLPTFAEVKTTILGDHAFLILCTSTFLISMVFMQGFSTLPIYIRSLGYSEIQFGLLIAINGVLIVLFQLPITQVLREYNRMRVIAAGGALVGLGFFMTSFVQSVWAIALSICVWTAGEIAQASFKNAVVVDLAPARLRASYQGALSMCFALAMTLGAPLGGAILEAFGPGTLWSLAAGIAGLAVVLYLSVTQRITSRIEAQAR